ncbi:hypothetical protein KCU89_g10332, partial [Aureobasidium melanogenum]
MAQIITNLVQGVGGGIGFVSEAYKAHKANKTQTKSETNSQQQETSTGDGVLAPNPEEEAWELDEAQDDLIGEPEIQPTDEAIDPGTLADAFISRLRPALSPADLSHPRDKLPFPII